MRDKNKQIYLSRHLHFYPLSINFILNCLVNAFLSLVHTVPDFSPGVATVWTPGPTGTTP